jgi:hypothetical protein
LASAGVGEEDPLFSELSTEQLDGQSWPPMTCQVQVPASSVNTEVSRNVLLRDLAGRTTAPL